MDRQGITVQGKLQVPPLRANLVRRASLLDFIDQATDAKVVVLSAPPGFGKTTLLAVKAHDADRTAWLSLDLHDNDPSRFWLNIVQALRTAEPEFSVEFVEMFGSTDPRLLIDGVLSLCNDMAALVPGGIHRLVLDDYHVIQNETIHSTLKTMIENLPTGWQLLLTTRSKPPFSLSLLRARGEVCEIGADQLRFSVAEARQFFERTAKVDLSQDVLTAISDRTEGWAAALQLLAVSLRTIDDRDEFIREFAGDSRLIADYFNAEVMARQSRTIQRFLVVSAIPERFCVPLAHALMDGLPSLCDEDAYAIVEYLEQANLFLMPLDQKRQWYRYHNLFHQLLRDRAQRQLGDELPGLQRKAADWLEQNLYYDDALQLMLQLEDYPGCERVIWSAGQIYFAEGRLFKLREWLRLLPSDCVANSPKIIFLASLIAFNAGQPKEAKKWLGLLVQLTRNKPELIEHDPVLAAELRGFSLFAEAWVETNRNNRAAASVIAPKIGEIIEQMKVQKPGTMTRLKLAHGELLFQCGEISQAREVFAQGIEACREWGYGSFAGSLYTRLAATHRVAGELRTMNRVAEDGIRFVDTTRATGRIEASGYLQQIIGEAHMERYQLDRAYDILYDLNVRSRRAEHYMLQVIAGVSLVVVLRCRGQSEDAFKLSQEIFDVSTDHDISAWYVNGPGPTRARAFLDAGDVDSAVEWADASGLAPGNEFDYLQEFEYLALSRILIARQEYDLAATLLARIRIQSESAGRRRVAMEAMILSSMVLQVKGDTTASRKQLEDALNIAGPANYARIFLDEGLALTGQLRDVPESNKNWAFVRRIIDLAPKQRDHIKKITLLGPEVLSKREIEVLQLISDGYSNRDVAAKLFLSPHTVKAHTRNIYDKLAVSSRTQAVAKASTLGLISLNH